MKTSVLNPEIPPVYEPINLELGPTDIKQTMDSYLDFLQLPEAEKTKLYHFDEAKPRTGMSGYVHKEEDDIKDVFHMTQVLRDKMMPATWRLPAISQDFLSNATEAYYSLARSTKQKYLELEEEMPNLTSIHFPRSRKLGHHLRLLAYQDSVDGS